MPRINEPKKTNGWLCGNLILQGYMPDHLDTVAYFARYSAHQMNIPTSKPIHLDTLVNRWWVVKGPFVHAKTKEVFERKTYKRQIQAFDANPSLIEKWLGYVKENLPAGIEIHAEIFSREPTNIREQIESQITAYKLSLLAAGKEENVLTFDQKVRSRSQEFLELISKKH